MRRAGPPQTAPDGRADRARGRTLESRCTSYDHVRCGLRRAAGHSVRDPEGVVDSTAFVKGEWGAEIVDALAPQEGDVIVEGKRGLDTFATTNLDFILRARGITTIALGGFLTNCCVESTMRSGYEKGYGVITLSDCVAGTSAEEHDNAIRFDYPMFSAVMTSDALADELQGAPVA
jgi:nicotinamidase-related amidase